MASTRSPPGPSGAAQDRMLGRVLGGRYRVLSRLGEGGMGAVYLCTHAVLGRRYAVKVLRPDLGRDEELVKRFRNEAIAASRIGCDNIVEVLDFGAEEDGSLYYVMEALDGRSLAAVIDEDGPLEIPRALGLLEQICGALGAAHARGIVHRDVKPDNVFLLQREDGSEHAKVIDFGISQVTLEGGVQERLTRTGAIIGTPEYMAPEQATGGPVDQRADVYALGVVAYEMLTGTLPILATTPVATLVAHQTWIPDAPSRRRPGIPPEIDALVLAALQKRPPDRPANMEELAARIAAIRAGPAQRLSGAAPVRSVSRACVETVALPASEGARRPRAGRVAGAALAAGVLLTAMVAAGRAWLTRPHASAVAPAPEAMAAASRAGPDPAPAPSAARLEAPVPGARGATADAAPRPEPLAAAPLARRSAPKPVAKSGARPAVPPRAPRPPVSRDHLDDPYSAGAALKRDPFE